MRIGPLLVGCFIPKSFKLGELFTNYSTGASLLIIEMREKR